MNLREGPFRQDSDRKRGCEDGHSQRAGRSAAKPQRL